MLTSYEFECRFCGLDVESLGPHIDCPECGFPMRRVGSRAV